MVHVAAGWKAVSLPLTPISTSGCLSECRRGWGAGEAAWAAKVSAGWGVRKMTPTLVHLSGLRFPHLHRRR